MPSTVTLTRELIAAVGRAEVEVPDAQDWPEWSRVQGIGNMYYRRLDATGGIQSGWVVTRPIPMAEWIDVIDMETNQSVLADVRSPTTQNIFDPTSGRPAAGRCQIDTGRSSSSWSPSPPPPAWICSTLN